MVKEQEQLEESKYYINRELSWLEFNDRVLQEAKDTNNPLFERLKFLMIVSSNLDEFFMVRIASLKDQVNAGYDRPDPSGLTPKEQLNKISDRVHRMVYEQYNALRRGILPKLKKRGIILLNTKSLSEGQKGQLRNYFLEKVYPVLTPIALEQGRPFPLILNRSLNLGVLLQKDGSKDVIFATVQVPSVLPRLIPLIEEEGKLAYILLEDVIKLNIHQLFEGYKIISVGSYRITRNADLTIEEEEAEDLLIEIEKSLQKRKWGTAVRLEVDYRGDKRLVEILRSALEIHYKDIFFIWGPIDLRFLGKIYQLNGFEDLKYQQYRPYTPKALEKKDIFRAISKEDILLHHPYESFEPVITFVQKAAKDPKVLAIKQTLYRVSGDSPIIKALADAAKKGKQVTVLVELKARFDEEVNIVWAKKLEQAGCHVIYGLVGLKTHCKMTLVVRQESEGIKRYLHLGTGNYNDITAKIYTDMGLFTSNKSLVRDATAIFNMLSGCLNPPKLEKTAIAPINLRAQFLELIKREITHVKEGNRGKIIAKMNSLVDKEIIKALYQASIEGVEIHLIVRGICCLRPSIPQISENIKVRSIVGRFLEHSRIYYFYNNGEEEVYMSSADLMPRNLDRRIEVLFPIEDFKIKKRIINILFIELMDNVKARILDHEGVYHKIDRRGKKLINSQDYFVEID
ncbi:RNA degradosome polyphosphate kinase [Alkaliphilus transvaalensis]|uniref:RNA degradosome polyphosphate kinase n=1 Tax=Alkaliphilus transvaalensis TaxID=114628 RepID=UPI000A0216CA|nr:RNA degradosome polyphosphate kinase [Alkaliphilus transvaalensis]